MTHAAPAAADVTEGPVMADGVDDEPIEGNRRFLDGHTYLDIAFLSGFYAIFRMAALNDWSIRGWTGVDIPLLPVSPIKTWNFAIVHIAGAAAPFAHARFVRPQAAA